MSDHDARGEGLSMQMVNTPWRTGGKVQRNIYTAADSGDGTIIGQLDSGMLAQHVVDIHNAWLEAVARGEV